MRVVVVVVVAAAAAASRWSTAGWRVREEKREKIRC
jgi:hypothetical protein